MANEEHPAVTNFRNYIRIKTVQPTPDYATCTTYLQGQAKEIGAECQVVECVPGKPAVIMTLPGEDPSLPAVLLNSHTDVVPVFPEHWLYDPFGAHKDEAGNIYGRGTQDMKCVGIQYLEALKRLQEMGGESGRFLRTVHLSFVPEEELGGLQGMGRLVDTETFKRMDVGVALDEGYASTTDAMKVFYGQRNPWWILIKCPGQPGHGSQFLQNTAGEKVAKIKSSTLHGIPEQELRPYPIFPTPNSTPSQLPSVHLLPNSQVSFQPMCTPSQLPTVHLLPNSQVYTLPVPMCTPSQLPTVHLLPNSQYSHPCVHLPNSQVYTFPVPMCTPPSQLPTVHPPSPTPTQNAPPPPLAITPASPLSTAACSSTLSRRAVRGLRRPHPAVGDRGLPEETRRVVRGGGGGDHVMEKAVTCVEDGKNPWWDAFSAACKKMGVVLEKEIFPASTDMKYIRKLGISALGFSPMNNTPILLHDHNEYLNEEVFLRGVDIYAEVIPALANLRPW
ncbi:hypothetical protein C7M84_011513 [Penaeus vannamei]|uniref:N-acyl-L-amino-acid amidohydrolase n=1 Tax=Penaeus vannamei TaxID=6689 RepID=A0A423T1E2_PENVA|nr:hypothetical protein C7M84_011513 [Penaeus vannamei]